jgi:hypothetical protein
MIGSIIIHVCTSGKSYESMALVLSLGEVVMFEHFCRRWLSTGFARRSIDNCRGIVISVELATFDILQPSMLCHLGDGDAPRRVWMKHGNQDAAEYGRADERIKDFDIRVARLGDLSIFPMLLIPLVPASNKLIIIGLTSLIFCFLPKSPAKDQVEHHNARTPDVKWPWIILALKRNLSMTFESGSDVHTLFL